MGVVQLDVRPGGRGLGGHRGGPEGGLVLPRLLSRLVDNGPAVGERLRLPVGGAEDIEPGLAKKLLQKVRFLELERGALLLEQALRPADNLRPLREAAVPEDRAALRQLFGRVGQQPAVARVRENPFLTPVEFRPHPLLRRTDHRLALGRLGRGRRPRCTAGPRLFRRRQILPAQRHRPEHFLASLQLLVHLLRDPGDNNFPLREALLRRRRRAALPVLRPQQHRAGRRRGERLLAGGEVGPDSVFDRSHDSHSLRHRRAAGGAGEDLLLRVIEPLGPFRGRAHRLFATGYDQVALFLPLAHQFRKVRARLSYCPVKPVTAASSRSTCCCKDSTCSCKASVRSACCFCSRSYCADNARKAAVSSRSISVIGHTHSCENREARRRVPRSSATNRLKLLTPLCHRIPSRDNRLVAQLPPKMPGERFRDCLTLHRPSSCPSLLLDGTGGIPSASCSSSASAAVARPVVLGALETLLFKVSPGVCSPLRVSSSIGAFPVPRRFPLPHESFPVEVGLVQPPLQPQPLSRLRPKDGHVVPALAGHFEAETLERRHHPGAVLHRASGHEPH